MAAKRTPITMWLDAADLAQLRAIRSRTGVPVVQQVRRAIRLAMVGTAAAARAFEAPASRAGQRNRLRTAKGSR